MVCFWAAYSLTRPLGASVADWLAHAKSGGGLGLGTGPVTAAGLFAFAAAVVYLTVTHADEEGHHELAHAEPEDLMGPAPAADVRPATDPR